MQRRKYNEGLSGEEPEPRAAGPAAYTPIVSDERQRPKASACFVEPMLLTRCSDLPEGPEWMYELKLDGYRALGFKTADKAHLRSRNDNDFNRAYPTVYRRPFPFA